MYTHIALGLDGPTGPFFSFSRKYPKFPLPGGFVREQPGAGAFLRYADMPCCLLQLRITEKEKDLIRQKLKNMEQDSCHYRYSILGVIGCFFHIPVRRSGYFFCSQFVANLLQSVGAASFQNPTSLVRPDDFLGLAGATVVYQGPAYGLSKEAVYARAS